MAVWILSSSLMIAALILLRRVLRGKISLRLQYALWLLVLIRLLIPWSMGSSILSLQNHIPQLQQQISAIEPATPSSNEVFLGNSELPPSASTVKQNNTNSVPEKQEESLPIENLLYFVWMFGVAGGAVILLGSNLSFARTLKRERRKLDLEIELPVYCSNVVETPCLFGLWRPSIYLTGQVLENEETLRHVLEHEYTHYLHKDHIWSLLRGICLLLHWYNPLVWLAVKLSKYDGELACDEGTIQRIGEEQRFSYGQTLIAMTCTKNNLQSWTVAATTMTGSKNSLKERILLLSKKPKKSVLAIVSAILAMSIAVSCTYTGKAQDSFKENGGISMETTEEPAEIYTSADISLAAGGYCDFPIRFESAKSGYYGSISVDITDVSGWYDRYLLKDGEISFSDQYSGNSSQTDFSKLHTDSEYTLRIVNCGKDTLTAHIEVAVSVEIDSNYSGGTNWSPVTVEEYLDAVDSPIIEEWLESCTDENKAYALKFNTEYRGLKRTQWLLFFAGQSGSKYNTGVDYGVLSTSVKVDFEKAADDGRDWLMFIHHTDDTKTHKGQLKVYYDTKAVDCVVTEVDFDLSYLNKLLEQMQNTEARKAAQFTTATP